MTIGSILLAVALLVAVGLYLARPFLFPVTSAMEVSELSEGEALVAQKEAVLLQIRELDFDHETGKVPPAEYETLRARYLADATHILKALDTLHPETARGARTDDIEAAIARFRRQPATAPKVAKAGDDIEAAVARLRQQRVGATANGGAPGAPARTRAGFCPQCGEARDSQDNFCAACGHAF